MITLCIHLGHDVNICIYDSDNQNFKYIKEERISGNKHDPEFHCVIDKINELPKVDVVVLAYAHLKPELHTIDLYNHYSNWNELYEKVRADSDLLISKYKKIKDVQRHWLKRYREILEKTNNLEVPIYCVQHDYAHILSGWMLGSGYEYGITIDGGGPDNNNKLIVKNPFDIKNVEVLFFSRLTNEPFDDMTLEDLNNRNSFGASIGLIGKTMRLSGINIDLAGKIMGMSAYGSVDSDITQTFTTSCPDISKFRMLDYFRRTLREFTGEYALVEKDNTDKCNFNNQKFLNIVANLHKVWSMAVLMMFEKFIPKNSKVIYAGGCAQNTVANKLLLKDYPDLDVVPHCYDGGLSFGCLGFFLLKNNLAFPKLKNFPYIQTDTHVAPANDETIKKVAKLLADGKIVGWYQGNGEIGPRALGNRSILMNPSIPNGKDILNSKVKHREHWRPFAPSVLEEYAGEWFDMNKSKYMMFAAQVKEDKKELIPSVTHEDGTSRIQTVCQEDNPLFYKLLQEFYSLTNIPMILNTSLNKGGGPIVGHPSQAIDVYENSDLDVLCIGDKLYVK